ncbi:acyltransferase [Paraburkholderia terrae]|uniref:acyltransferase family protein n=1 Tax=Paraburkholderia terrae TaxID=311230 RepID=UPI001EE395FC|nr:acyltransferase [Paraburkholderia terrae]GJH05459.1 acyltransferase family protein [Paraburkholderia terrae]
MSFTGTLTWLDRIGSRCVERTRASAAGTPGAHAATHVAAHVSSGNAAASAPVTKAAAHEEARVAALDAGRALAIVGVILVHLALFMPALPAWLQAVSDMGQYGVQLFFVISAVTIMLTLEEESRRFGDDRSLIARRFYIKRFFRIAPLYYVAIAVYSLGNHLAGRFDTQVTAPHGVSDVVANLVFIHAWVPSAVNTVVPGGWSIGVEMCFYLFAPFIFIATRTRRGLWRTSLALLVISAVALTAGACTDEVCTVENNSFLYYWPPTQLPCFVVGFVLARYGKRLLLRDGMKLSMFGIACTLAACAALLALLYATGSGLGLAHWLAPTVAACAAAALLLLLAQLPRRYPGARIVAAFGQNSYGLYIWSFVVILAVRVALKTPLDALDHRVPVLGFMIAAVFACCASYVAARISATRIERPCAQWARQVLLPRVAREKRIERVSSETSD